MKATPLTFLCLAWIGTALSAPAAPGGGALEIPDFTRGDALPAKANHE